MTFTVEAASIPPALQVTPESLSFEAVAGQAERADRTLSIANTGGGTLEWAASDDAGGCRSHPTTARVTVSWRRASTARVSARAPTTPRS